ncbi:MAG TPA: hypothetical protein DIV86_05500 [Alphaproteobacteria bacterium]|nr:hypothetical protein [Alphaproteobacteria bacterium]
MRSLILIFSIILFSLSTTANAQEFQGEFKNWGVFTINQGGQRVCYITSTPIEKKGNYRSRGEPYMLVTRRNSKSEVSINSGFPFKSGSEVTVSVNVRFNYGFFTSPETPEMAWAKSSAADADLIGKMKSGARLTSKGFSKLGTYAQDTYSLAGFTGAYNKMATLCK